MCVYGVTWDGGVQQTGKGRELLRLEAAWKSWKGRILAEETEIKETWGNSHVNSSRVRL